MIEAQLEALAVDTRRRIYTMLVERPRSVQGIADELPVSRPAVSQHLKVLVDAGLAKAVSLGARRVYSADPAGVAEFREWADRIWTDAIGSFADFAGTKNEEDEMLAGEIRIEPVVKTLRLGMTPDEAFEVFTERIGDWWPLDTHSIGQDRAVSARFEPEVGGRIVEMTADGMESVWGQVTSWEKAQRVEFTWYPGLPEDQQTLVDVRFREAPGGCEMILIHTGWEARGEAGPSVRENYDAGWDFVLGKYTDAAGG
jgi:DNA-binding transcriptional ArsR family regulator